MFKKHFYNQSSQYENTDSSMCLRYINHCLKVKYPLCFFCWNCSTVAQMKNYLKSTSAIKVATEPTIFAVSEDEWNTKEDSHRFQVLLIRRLSQ